MHLQPELTASIPIKTNNNTDPHYKTISEILAYIENKGWGNSFVAVDGGYSWGGLIIYPFTAQNVTDLYLSDNDGLPGTITANSVAVSRNINNGSHSFGIVNAIVTAANGAFTVQSQSYLNFADVTVDDIPMMYINGNVSQYGDYNTIYIGSTYENIYINGESPITYTWSSVPAISGKNGILSLSQVATAALNDGEPVGSASRSDISVLSANSCLGNLLLKVSLDMSKVVASYFIPDEVSQQADYIKLVYKLGSEPQDVSDGTATDIVSGQTHTVIDGICDGNTYYFKIFTDEFESNVYEFTSTSVLGGDFFIMDLEHSGRDKIRYNASKTVHYQKLYYGEVEEEFDTTQGALFDLYSHLNPSYTISNNELYAPVAETYLGWCYDITENQKIIPANCYLYFSFDACLVGSAPYIPYLDCILYDDRSVEVTLNSWVDEDLSNTWKNYKTRLEIVNGVIQSVLEEYIDDVWVRSVYRYTDHMVCINENNPRPLYAILFRISQPTKIKNFKIYWWNNA